MGLITSKQKIEPVSGEKKAVLIGFKHPGINNDHIKGSIIRMKKNLMDLRGFSENNIVLMIQDEPSYSQPDEYNMEDTLASLFEDANPFDTLFIHLIAPYASQGTNDDIPAGTLPLPIIHAYSILIVVPVVLSNQLVACSYFSLYFISNHLLYYSFFSFFFLSFYLTLV